MNLADISETESEDLKDKINGLATQSKNKNISNLYQGVNEFKGYPPRTW
jgi:hypothetical protein